LMLLLMLLFMLLRFFKPQYSSLNTLPFFGCAVVCQDQIR